MLSLVGRVDFTLFDFALSRADSLSVRQLFTGVFRRVESVWFFGVQLSNCLCRIG